MLFQLNSYENSVCQMSTIFSGRNVLASLYVVFIHEAEYSVASAAMNNRTASAMPEMERVAH